VYSTVTAHTAQLIDLGNKAYQATWDYQEQLMAANLSVKQAQRTAQLQELAYTGPDTQQYFLFVEHPHVFTLGKSGHEDNLLASAAELQLHNAEYIKTNRGGDITYHGPGQIVGYPIFDLEKSKPDLVWYMRTLEQVIINTLADFGIQADRLQGATGVWLSPHNNAHARKICAMGVRTSRWITMHGFALNVNTNLDYFNLIVPCGITDKQVTSMQQELGRPLDIALVKQSISKYMQQLFQIKFTTHL
jgi:lipoyl(octanoyl) transferase